MIRESKITVCFRDFYLFSGKDCLYPKVPCDFDPRRPDFAPYGLTCERWTPSLMRRPDRHNEIELNLLESGSITYLSGGRKVKIDSHRLAVFWAAIPHQIIDIVGRHTYFVATLPLAWFLQCGFDDRLVQPILHGQVLSDPSKDRGATDADLFRRWLGDLNKAERPGRRAMMLELEARLVRLASSLPPHKSAARPTRSGALEAQRLTKAEQMACFIAQHYLEPLSVEQISQSVQLHPNYAMNLFKRVFSHDRHGLRQPTPDLPRPAPAGDQRRKDSLRRLKFRLRIDQPLQQRFSPRLRNFAQGISQGTSDMRLILSHAFRHA